MFHVSQISEYDEFSNPSILDRCAFQTCNLLSMAASLLRFLSLSTMPISQSTSSSSLFVPPYATTVRDMSEICHPPPPPTLPSSKGGEVGEAEEAGGGRVGEDQRGELSSIWQRESGVERDRQTER